MHALWLESSVGAVELPHLTLSHPLSHSTLSPTQLVRPILVTNHQEQEEGWAGVLLAKENQACPAEAPPMVHSK